MILCYDRNHAILDYLHSQHYEDTADYFKTEARLVEPEKVATDEEPLPFTVLEQRWSNTVRLLQRIDELEDRVKKLQLQLRICGGSTSSAASSSAAVNASSVSPVPGESGESESKEAGDGMQSNTYLRFPRAPEKMTLTGHRSAVTSLAFHPAYTFVFLFFSFILCLLFQVIYVINTVHL